MDSISKHFDPYRCSRCGFCLAACPTYRLEPLEPDSPRGRLTLLSYLASGGSFTPAAAWFLDRCIGCRACEAACPAGIKPAREILSGKPPSFPRSLSEGLLEWLWRFGSGKVMPRPARLRLALKSLPLLRRTGLLSPISRLPGLAPLSRGLEQIAAILPAAPVPREKRAHLLPSYGKGKYRVAFFTGCITEAALGTVNDAAIELLRHAGCTVIVPPAQTCCGALSHHCGDKEAAFRLARRNLAAFEAAEPFDFVTGTAAACIVHLQEYPELLAPGPAERNTTQRFSSRVRDFAGLLRELEPALVPAATGRAACHESCLLRHSAGGGAMTQILSSLPGVEPVPAPHLGCCGSAGGYFFRHPEVALGLLDAEIGALKNTGANTVVTDNPGCLLFLRYGLDRHNINRTRVLHLAEFLKPRRPAGQAQISDEGSWTRI